ncbi:unnamed protein product [Vitrella brassicaformis CCMP3155]|uniref:RING-type domain-containing protein n=1 Tax=Vitrella brassicaformis (strain CCMP3155) TaxID=1169540 RepID=A0A0G4GFU3_VITBC|nr:unnamed protein product [Vitrella brassicaformis CCMP3155]|eukprot:CEM28183.1 unnamed protein product [Vitrella brassicaformis CCMP3155]
MDTAAVQSTSKAQRKRAKKAKKRGAAPDASQDGREADEAAPSTASDKPPVETRNSAMVKSLRPDKSAPLAELLADAARTSSLIFSPDATCPISIEAIFSDVRQLANHQSCISTSYQLRWLLCNRVYEAIRLDMVWEASRDGRLDVCVRAVREAAEQLASEAYLQRVLSVKMWRFLVTLIEDVANQLEADFDSFAQAIKAMRPSSRSSSNQPTRQPSATPATRLPIFPPATDPVQLVLQHSPSPHHRFAEARLLPPDGLMRLLELFRLDKGPIPAAGSYTWDMFVDEYVAADCALGEGDGHKRAGSFTVSGATGSLAALNGSYVIRPTAEEQARLVAPPDGAAFAYVGEGVVFERLVVPIKDTLDGPRGVWVAYEPATEARSTPRLLAVGLHKSDIRHGSFATHPALPSPAFETDQWYTVDDGARLVKVDFSISAALPLDFYVCRSAFSPTDLLLVAALLHFRGASLMCTAISDSADSLAEVPDTQLLAYYVSPEVMENLPPSAHNPEPVTDVASVRPITGPMGERSLCLRDGEATIRRLGLMRLSDEWTTRPFTQWPFKALALLPGGGGMVGGRFEGGRVAVVRLEVSVSTKCALCDAQPDGSTLGDMPLLHALFSPETSDQDFAYLDKTVGVWTQRASSEEPICGKCWCTEYVMTLLSGRAQGNGASSAASDDDDATDATHPAAAAAQPSGHETSVMAVRDSFRDMPNVPAKDKSTPAPATPSATPGHDDSDQDGTTRCQAPTPAGADEESKGTPQAATAVVGASGPVSIESAFGSTQYVRGLLAREGPWECGVDLRAVFEELAQKLTDTAFEPVFRLRRVIVGQVLECVQLDQLSEGLTKAGNSRPMEATAASLQKEAELVSCDGKHQTLCCRHLWYIIVAALECIAEQMERDSVAFVKAMQDIRRRRIQEQDASSTADATLPPLPAAGDNFYDFARQAVATLVQQGPPDYTYLETHLRTFVDDTVGTADPIRDLLFFFRLDQGPPKSPTQGGTERESAWHATYRGYFDQCRTVDPTGGRRHGSLTVSGAPVINGTYLLRPTEEEQKTLLWTHPETIAYVGKKNVFKRLVYPRPDGNMGGLWMAHSPSTADGTRVRIIAFGPFKDDSVSNRNPLLSHPAAANPALETREWFAVDQEGHISRLGGVKMTTTLPLTFHVPRSALECVSKPLACESLYDYYTHYLAERGVSKGAAFPMAFYLDAQVMEHLPTSARHKERLTDASQRQSHVACVSDAETLRIKRGMVRLADEYVTKAFTEWPFAAVLALLATGSADSVCVLRAESRTQTCGRCGEPCAGSSEGPVDTIPLVHTLAFDDLNDELVFNAHAQYIRAAPAGLCVESATGSLMCGPCALDRVESAKKDPIRPDLTPVDVLATFSSLLSPPSDTQTVPSPQPKSASSSSTPSRNSPATSSIFRGIFTAKDKTKPTPPKSAPTAPKPKPTSTQPPTPPSKATPTVTVESIHEAFPDIATVTSGTEGGQQPSSETLAVVKAFLQHKGGAVEGGGVSCVESSECDAAQVRETYRRAVKKFFMDHRTALQSDPSAVFALGPLRHVRGEWLPQWHTTFVSELSKGQQLMQKELGAATTRVPKGTNGTSTSLAAMAIDEDQLKEDIQAATAALRRHPSSRLFRLPYPHPDYARMYQEGRPHSISDLEKWVPGVDKEKYGWRYWLDYIFDIACSAIAFVKSGSEVSVSAAALVAVATRLARRYNGGVFSFGLDELLSKELESAVGNLTNVDHDAVDQLSDLDPTELARAASGQPGPAVHFHSSWGLLTRALNTLGSAASVSPPDAATRTDTHTGDATTARTQDESTTPTAGRRAPDEPQAEIDKLTDKCARLERELAAAHEKLKTAEDTHTKEKDGLNGTIKRLQDDVKRLTSESAASKKMAEKERKAADAQRSTLEDILKDKDKQIKQTQETADDRVRRVSQQVRQEADKAAKTQTDTVTKQHREELDALRGEHRSAILELRAQHRMAIEQRETEVRGEADRALADVTRKRDQLRQRLREKRLRSARVDQEKDVELSRLREAEAPLRREILTLKQQLSSAQPPHSRVSTEGMSSLDLPSVRQLLDGLTSEQHRLTQLHQAAIERQIQLRHQQQPNHTSPSCSSSSTAAAAVPTHTAAPSMPFCINNGSPPPPPVSGSSSSPHANGPCAAPSSSSSSSSGGVGSSVSKCQLCLENPPDIILLPCGHKVVCQECFEKWMAPMPTEDKLCPEHTCRQPYSEVRYIFE